MSGKVTDKGEETQMKCLGREPARPSITFRRISFALLFTRDSLRYVCMVVWRSSGVCVAISRRLNPELATQTGRPSESTLRDQLRFASVCHCIPCLYHRSRRLQTY